MMAIVRPTFSTFSQSLHSAEVRDCNI